MELGHPAANNDMASERRICAARPMSTILLALLLAGCSSPVQTPAPTLIEPTIGPPSAATPVAELPSNNLALGRAASASASLADQQPSNAVDGDLETNWGAGAHPPQWIEIDLGDAFDIDRLVLIPSQFPEGPTVHQIWGRGDAGDYRVLHEFRGSTADGVALEVSPTAAWAAVRYLKIETTESPSWVAWREVEAYGSPAVAGPVAAGGAPDIIFHNGNLLTMEEDRPAAQAIAIAGDRILAVGSDSEVLALAGPGTTIVDLQGRTMTPGFINGHSHHIPQRYKWGFDGLDQAVQSALEQGWTGLTELAVDQAELDELIEAAEGGRLPVRVNAYLLVKTFEGESLGEWFNAYRPGQTFGTTLRIAGLKVFTDFDNGTVLYWEPAELEAFLRQRSEEGWQVTLKSVSTLSLELVLDAVEPILQGGSNAGPRYRIEHALAVNDAQLARLARMGIIASIQPGIVGVISGEPDLSEIVAREGTEAVARWRDMADAGVPMVGSPYNPDGVNVEYTSPSHVSPLGVAYRGATQIGLAGHTPEAWMVQHALSVEEILPLLTIDAAYATIEESERGSLAPGKLADVVILSQNPLAVPVASLLEIDTLMTMVGGDVAWCAPGAEALCSGAASPLPPPPAADAPPGWPVLGVGSRGPEAFALQYLLRHHNQDIPADGLFGPVTEQAVMTFQSQRGLGVDGLVGGQTWPALVQGVVLQRGSSGDAVRAAQVLLLEKFGYADIIVVDGLFGRGTEAVVKTFQADHGLTSDGMVGSSQTWPALISTQP
jgi:predicted amidohydrolase YtcJ/peptidoglycan hydrolase-like protein with peptidoglycan-binding domain